MYIVNYIAWLHKYFSYLKVLTCSDEYTLQMYFKPLKCNDALLKYYLINVFMSVPHIRNPRGLASIDRTDAKAIYLIIYPTPISFWCLLLAMLPYFSHQLVFFKL